jgi:DNA-binding HxlR family transcriptional regulator
MAESGWKMVMDRDVVTITGDHFQLTTNDSDPGRLDTIVSELQSMTRGNYGQYCGLSRAVEMMGERWGMLVLRDLVVDPKSAAELHDGLPRVPDKLLRMRLKELAHSGIIRPTGTSDPNGDDRYELTEYGRALEDVLLALGRWGAATLTIPRPEDIVTEDSLMVALRATFLAEAAGDVRLSFELHVADVVVHGLVDRSRLHVKRGPLPGADVVINPGAAMIALLNRELSPAEALADGQVRVTDPALFERFVAMFALPHLPTPHGVRI